MNAVEKTGKTIEEAIEAAALDLGAVREQIDFQVLEEPSKGLFGLIGGKPAKVKVWIKEKEQLTPEPSVKPNKSDCDPVGVAKEFLTQVFKAMKLEVKIERLTHPEHVTFNLRGTDLGILIGKHGQTLDALQYLTNLAAHRDSEERIKIILDVEDYRKRRAETLSRLALRLADRVKAHGEKVVLEPMSPHERKVIHMTLQDDYKVTTYSEGEEPFRKVVIALKK